MQRIPYVQPIEPEDVDGSPLLEPVPNGAPGERRPQTIRQLDFFRGRISDPVFVEGLDPGDGADLQYETRRALRLQEKAAIGRGYWEVEDDPARRLLNATNKGAYHKGLAF